MTRPMSREERKAAYMKQAEAMFEEIEGWYDAHPEASFEEIEEAARGERRKMMGKAMEVLINGRDVGKEEEAPKCEGCGEKMKFQGYRTKEVVGLEGDSQIERAYYVCKVCKKETIFPPGQEAKTEK